MAETRKHRVEVRDELDKALLAALGEPVRPVEPGQHPRPSSPADGEPEASEAVTRPPTSFIAPGSSLGAFTFGQAEPPQED